MPQKLEELKITEVSLVDRPANAENGVPRARIALFKRDDSEEDLSKAVDGKTEGGTVFPKGDFAYTPDDTPSHWKLRLTSSPGGKADARIVGAAVAALGKGFRGNKVQIPASALPAVKARVRAAWREANPGKGSDELPDVLAKGESTMTVQEIEKRLEDQDAVLKTQDAALKALTADNEILKAETETVLKMSKKDRKLYGAMSADERKNYMAGDEEKRKTMMEGKAKAKKEKKLVDCMEDQTRGEFEKAGPAKREIMLKAAEETRKLAKAAKAKSGPKPDDGDGDNDEDEMDGKKKRNKVLTMKVAEAEDTVLKANERISKAEEALASITKRERLHEFTKRAEAELPYTSGSPEEKGAMLMTMADSLPGGEKGDAFGKVLTTLKAADKALSLHFGEVGKSGGAIPAEAAFMQKATEIAKRDKIDTAHAIEKAMMENPELYMEYERDQRRVVRSA